MSNQQAHAAAVLGAANVTNGEDMMDGAGERKRGRPWADHAAADEAWEREHATEWMRVDGKLRGIAGRRAMLDAEEAHLLRYAEELKLWRGFACGSMIEYMERALGYAPRTAIERLRVARAIAELPLLAEALEDGALAHSAVRELTRVAVPDTEAVWLEAARGKSLREIEAMVSGRRPGDRPTDPSEPRLHRRTITIELSPETYDLLRTMHKLAAEEHGQRLSDDELISSVFRKAYGDGVENGGGDGGGDGGGGDGGAGSRRRSHAARGGRAGSPAYKIAIKQCPDCKRAWQFSGGRDIEVRPEVAECAACDAVHLGSLDAAVPERATTTVTPRKREQVLARDGYRCTVPGCRRNIGLDLHHIEYQSRGGGHGMSNMLSMCDLHHKAVHFGKLVIRGTAPGHLTFEFRGPRDRWNLTDDDATGPGPTRSPARATRMPDPGVPAVAPTWAREPRLPRDAVEPTRDGGGPRSERTDRRPPAHGVGPGASGSRGASTRPSSGALHARHPDRAVALEGLPGVSPW